MTIQTSITDHYITLAVQRQIMGLEKERVALIEQIKGLVEERDIYKKLYFEIIRKYTTDKYEAENDEDDINVAD